MTIKVEQPFLQLLLERSPQHSPLQDCCYNDSDDCSVSTSSTFPFSDTSISDDDVVRRVSFANELVSEVVTRPRTPVQDISQLYYSTEEIASFRQDYRLERKLLSELSLDYSTADDEQLERLTAGSFPSSKHFIHRVVVVSHNGVETFFTKPSQRALASCQADDQAFFDNDSFWSGSITWY